MADGLTLADAIMEARPRVVAALAGHFRDLDAAEEGFAEGAARLIALDADARPANVAGWLHAVARRWLVDGVRARQRHARAAALQAPIADAEADMGDVLPFPEPVADEALRLIFGCAHPAIAPDMRVALALRHVCGVPMERLAPAMLVPVPTLYQRMGRAKTKIREAGIGFDVPARRHWPERMEGVLACLELGYAIAYQDGAAALDADLAPEVRRLAHILADLLPDDAEVLGLAALVEFAESRRAARVDGEGMMIPLSRQYEALWDDGAIARGHALMARAAALGTSGPRQIIAAIHMTHARRKRDGATDWAALLRLYDVLCTLRPGPAAETARALVVARIEGPAAGLAKLDTMPVASVAHYRPWFSARAHLLAETGDRPGAAEALRKAIALAPPPAERRYLEARLSAL